MRAADAAEERSIPRRGGNSFCRRSLKVPGETEFRQKVDAPLARVPVVPANAVAIIGREAVVKIVKPLAVGENGADPVVARRLSASIGLGPKGMGEGIYKEGGMQDEDDA